MGIRKVGILMNDTRIHRYQKTENALRAIVNFNSESDSPYKWHSYNIYIRDLYRSIEECPGFFDSTILEYCNEILEIRGEHTSENLNRIKELAREALKEIEWEKKTKNDLYPCINL